MQTAPPSVRQPTRREAAEELEREIAQLETELSLDREVYDRLSTLEARGAADPLEKRLHERALREADIEISFPQRDLHLRSVDPQVWKQLRDDEGRTR